jgi:hypothetical protein
MRSTLLLIASLLAVKSQAQRTYFQQAVNYRLSVKLNDSLHQLVAQAEIVYKNQSPDTLTYIWFHLWPNAYKSEQTALGKQLLQNGDTRFYFSGAEQKGYINQLNFTVDGKTASTSDHPEHIDIVKLHLPNLLFPGDSIRISTPFFVQLPEIFSRSGHGRDKIYQITQWYPKPAVYDRDGWHPMPYLDQGEFYSEFGNYELKITVPEEYVVASTGTLTDVIERNKLSSQAKQGKHDTTHALFDKNGNRLYKTLHYRADSVHDVAWFASPKYEVRYDTCQLSDGSVKEIWHFHNQAFNRVWDRSIEYSKQALKYYSDRVGTYPYPVISVVESAGGPGGGMEYPMLSVIDPTPDSADLQSIIIHEIGHNWFYGALASNERKFPWLDEGLNSYYEKACLPEPDDPTTERFLEFLYYEKKDQPINTRSEDFSQLNYAAIAYEKTADWMRQLEKAMGSVNFDKAMQDYYQSWKFKHPNPNDLQQTLQKHSTANLDHFFDQLDKTGPFTPQPKRGWIVQSLVGWTKPDRSTIKNQITYFPALGYNQADGVQVGLGISNLKLPLNQLQWLVIPLYATGSKQINGLGFVNHRWRTNGLWHRVDLGLSVSKFSYNRFTAPNGQTLTLGFTKLAPGVRLTWKEDPRSTRNRHLQFTYFHFSETGYRFKRDTIIQGADTTIKNYYQTRNESRGLFQARYRIEENRKLYPYQVEFKLEGNQHFIRPTLTANQFFNYPKGGGLYARLFAGGFQYLGNPSNSSKFRQARYYLQMSGPTGDQDYTYSNYFIGRSAFEGIASQQIMERDGSFKLRTDRLASPVGRSDAWLVALNLSSSIPDHLNPLRVLPIRIPLHLFLDIGTSGVPSTENANWLYVAGLELPLFQRNFRLFIPIVYSQPFREYVQSVLEPKKRFWQKMSFQINLTNWNPRKVQPELDLW